MLSMTSARTTWPRAVALGAGLLLGLGVPARAQTPAGGEKVHFGFHVDDGEVWTKSIEAHNSRDYKGRAPSSETEVDSEVRLTFEKGTQGTVTVLIVPLSATTTVDGVVQANPAQQIAVGHEIRLDLDAQGKAVAGSGFTDLMQRFEKELDPETFGLVRQQMSVEGMKQGEIAEWNRPLNGLRGSDVRVGETWTVLSDKLVRRDYVPLSGSLTFKGWTELDGIRALTVEMKYDSTGEEYAAAESVATNELNFRPEDRGPYNRHNLILHGKTTWLISPERGLPLYETHEEVMLIPFSMKDPSERAEVRESHAYRFRPQQKDEGT
jgi:hypothetical protein